MAQNIDHKFSIEALDRPAFWVNDGIVTEVNTSAQQQYLIEVGQPVDILLSYHAEEYAKFKSGKLYLQVSGHNATVTAYKDGHLFVLDSEISLPEQRVLIQTSQHLRDPLSSSVINTSSLLDMGSVKENPDIYNCIAQINRNLHQILRTVNNMSDAALPSTIQKSDRTLQNAKSVFDEIFEKANQYVQATGHELQYKGLKQSVTCCLNYELLERSVLNLISNAVKFSDPGSTIRVTIQQSKNKIALTIANSCTQSMPKMHFNIFRNYLREPIIEDGRLGIGFGMTIVRNAALAHKGTLLLDASKSNNVRVTMTITIDSDQPMVVKSPIVALGCIQGGWEPFLVELADVLPDHFYETQ